MSSVLTKVNWHQPGFPARGNPGNLGKGAVLGARRARRERHDLMPCTGLELTTRTCQQNRGYELANGPIGFGADRRYRPIFIFTVFLG